MIPSKIAGGVDPRFFSCSLASSCVLLTAPVWYLQPAEVCLQVDLCLDSFLEQFLVFILFLEVDFFPFFPHSLLQALVGAQQNIQCCRTTAVSVIYKGSSFDLDQCGLSSPLPGKIVIS